MPLHGHRRGSRGLVFQGRPSLRDLSRAWAAELLCLCRLCVSLSQGRRPSRARGAAGPSAHRAGQLQLHPRSHPAGPGAFSGALRRRPPQEERLQPARVGGWLSAGRQAKAGPSARGCCRARDEGGPGSAKQPAREEGPGPRGWGPPGASAGFAARLRAAGPGHVSSEGPGPQLVELLQLECYLLLPRGTDPGRVRGTQSGAALGISANSRGSEPGAGVTPALPLLGPATAPCLPAGH